MFEAIKSFVADFTGGDKHPDSFSPDDSRVASAALLIHAATVDGNFGDAERENLRVLVQSRFDLDDETAEQLIAQATEAENEAVDFFRFTSVLMRKLDEEGRLRFVEMMWQMIYADGRVTEFEENLIWRVADLLGISSRQRILLRERVASQRAGGG
jgi:uncharacterized tellurite resistance protein B-like protein